MTYDVGTDRRIVRHPAPGPAPAPGARPKAGVATAVRPDAHRVAVVGGGIAGLTAATALAERGVRVELLERESYLGGRVGSWPDRLPDGTAVSMSRGFHAFFRQYYNLRQLLRRTDPGLERLTGVDDYPLIDADGRRDTFRGLPRHPPWNALAFAARSPTFSWRDLLRLNGRAALPLATVEVPRIYEQLDELDAGSLLEAINFPPAARHLAFEVFSRSFFASPGELSAAELAVMFHIYFLGSAEGLIFDVPTDTFGASLWHPLAAHLTDLGVVIRPGTAVDAVEAGGDRRYRVHDGSGTATDVDAVVLATDVRGLQRLLARSPQLGTEQWRDQIATARAAPPFLVHRLWLDRPVRADRPAFLGTGGWGPLDNITVLDRYEAEAGRWAAANGGAVVELHAYAAASGTAADTASEVPALTRELKDLLHKAYPETRTARITAALSQWRDDCPLFAPGTYADRPTVRTPDDQLVLAGDGIRIDLPVALMERAATTGWQAGNQLLAGWGLPGHDLYTVPTQGRLGVLRRLAGRRPTVAPTARTPAHQRDARPSALSWLGSAAVASTWPSARKGFVPSRRTPSEPEPNPRHQPLITTTCHPAASEAKRKHPMTKPSVLFVCVHNAGRSQMAAGWLRHLAGDTIEVRSAGSAPRDQLNPTAVEAMQEVGIDITSATPQRLETEAVQASDVVITMGCGDACPIFPGKRYEDWELTDPAGQPLETVRRVRDDIRTRVEKLITELQPA